MNKLTTVIILAGVGLVALARQDSGRKKKSDPARPVPAAPSTQPKGSGASIDPGIVVRSPFTGDPGIVQPQPRPHNANDPSSGSRPDGGNHTHQL